MTSFNPQRLDPKEPIIVERWPSELPLFVTGVMVGIFSWLIIAALIVVSLPYSLFVVLYVAIIVVAFFTIQVGFITHVRGSAVRLGPEQFPELYERVRLLAARLGIARTPEVYLMQAGGALNALATKFLRANMVVLYSDLLEACGGNTAAEDMIITHELGHLRAGHLRFRWLLAPFALVPFLGMALSRAREYTCDRFGLAGAGDKESALLGLSILAAGGKFGPGVNRRALASQRSAINTGWMTIGQWLSSHPPLAKRLAAIDPGLEPGPESAAGGVLRALAIMAASILIAAACVFFALKIHSPFMGRFLSGGGADLKTLEGPAAQTAPQYVVPDTAAEDLDLAFTELATFLEEELAAGRSLPEDYEELLRRWQEANEEREIPIDPYDGQEMGYERTDSGYILWSSGPDGEPDTEDDILYKQP